MTCSFLGVQTLGTETLNLRVTILLDTKFVRLLRSQAAALNDNRNPGRRSLREEALPCCVPRSTGEHIVARVVPFSTRLL